VRQTVNEPARARRWRRRLEDLGALETFLRQRKWLWLALLICSLLAISLLLYVAQTEYVSPFVYPSS
jgi:hypothetical protein